MLLYMSRTFQILDFDTRVELNMSLCICDSYGGMGGGIGIERGEIK
jgi:hypothetical protein